MNNSQNFSAWILTHESECRTLVRRLFAGNKGVVRFGIDADDVWHETFRRISQSDPKVNSSMELFGLVKTIATRIVCDKARRYALRKPLFDKPEVMTAGDFVEDPADSKLTPDEVALSEEQITLLHDLAASDAATKAIFDTICELIDRNIPATVANISRHLSQPYTKVRKAHLKLQRLIRNDKNNGQIATTKIWR